MLPKVIDTCTEFVINIDITFHISSSKLIELITVIKDMLLVCITESTLSLSNAEKA